MMLVLFLFCSVLRSKLCSDQLHLKNFILILIVFLQAPSSCLILPYVGGLLALVVVLRRRSRLGADHFEADPVDDPAPPAPRQRA